MVTICVADEMYVHYSCITFCKTVLLKIFKQSVIIPFSLAFSVFAFILGRTMFLCMKVS